MNNIILVACSLLLSSCSLFTPKIEYVKVAYPILECPAPPVLNRPQLYINMLADGDNIGKVAQYYNITLEQLVTYINTLELVIDRYSKTSESYIRLKSEMESMKINGK